MVSKDNALFVREHDMDWTGSSQQRKPQGVCLPPKRPANKDRPFRIPAGSPCKVRHIGTRSWVRHTTKTENGFDRYETHHDGFYTFRSGVWVMFVLEEFVKRQ